VSTKNPHAQALGRIKTSAKATACRANGRMHKKRFSLFVEVEMIGMRRHGFTMREIADRFHCSPSTVARIVGGRYFK